MLRKLLDLHYRLLEQHPQLKLFKPILDATDAFFYGQPTVTQEKPHIRDGVDVKRFMITVLFAVLPSALAAVYFYGWRAIVVILTSYIVGGLVEVLFCVIRKEEITEGFLITGILYPLILPPTLPLWMVALGIAVGVALGKEVFGGTGKNLFNAAIVARCFVYICFPLYMTGSAFVEPFPNTLQLDQWKPSLVGLGGLVDHRGILEHRQMQGKYEAVSEATPLATWKDYRIKATSAESTEQDYKAYMAYVKSTLPKLFWGMRSGCLGETCAFLLILGGIGMIVTRVANWRTIVSTIVAGLVIGFFLYEGQSIEDRLYLALFSILSGGFLFGAIFMATDPVTGPCTQTGRYFYGFGIGAITIIIRRFSGYPEGMMFAILLMNIFASLIDEIVIAIRYRR